MRHETGNDRQLEKLSRAIGTESVARDADGAFPAEAFETLRAGGLLAAPPIGAAQCGALLRLLAAGKPSPCTLGAVAAKYLINEERG